MVRGILTGHVMEAVGSEVFSGAQGREIVDETLGQLDTLRHAGRDARHAPQPAPVRAAAESTVGHDRRRRRAA